jgi:hypothetical protein
VLTGHGSSQPCPSSRNRDGGGSGGGETLTVMGRIRGNLAGTCGHGWDERSRGGPTCRWEDQSTFPCQEDVNQLTAPHASDSIQNNSMNF